MNQTSGTYEKGKVVLGHAVDWRDGSPVTVFCGAVAGPSSDICVDGSIWDDTPDAMRAWVAWFDSRQPVLTGKELERFEGDLRAIRDKQKELLPAWEKRIEKLMK